MPATHHSATESLGKAWRWVPGLYAAGEIPSSMIIYVSLLMFLQLDCGSALSTCYSSLLFLPSVLLPLCRHFLLRTARVHIQFYGVQLALLASLVWLAYTFPHGRVGLWLPLLAVSALSVWHRMLADALLEQQMDARSRQFLAQPVLLARQASLVLTYGVLIILVGGLQVITRQPLTAWSKGLFILTGMVLLLFAGVLSTHRFPATRFHATPPLPFSFPAHRSPAPCLAAAPEPDVPCPRADVACWLQSGWPRVYHPGSGLCPRHRGRTGSLSGRCCQPVAAAPQGICQATHGDDAVDGLVSGSLSAHDRMSALRLVHPVYGHVRGPALFRPWPGCMPHTSAPFILPHAHLCRWHAPGSCHCSLHDTAHGLQRMDGRAHGLPSLFSSDHPSGPALLAGDKMGWQDSPNRKNPVLSPTYGNMRQNPHCPDAPPPTVHHHEPHSKIRSTPTVAIRPSWPI